MTHCGYYVSMRNPSARVYGIGNTLIDIITSVTDDELAHLGLHKGTMHLTDRRKRVELEEFLTGRTSVVTPGGDCPNTLITLHTMGVDTTLAGKVGNDNFGKMYTDRLRFLGVRNELAISDEPTGSSIILVTPDSERTMNTYLGANRLYSAHDIVLESLRLSDVFYFTGYMWDTPEQQNAIMTALEETRGRDIVVVFDVADSFAVGRYRDTFLKIITDYCDIVFANSEEARILFNNYDPYECCRSMGKLCRIAIVKDGKRGSYISRAGKIVKIPVRGSMAPVDTTGAGDIYAAGFLYGLCTGRSTDESGEIASFLAGETISQQGAQFTEEKAFHLRTALENGSWRELP